MTLRLVDPAKLRHIEGHSVRRVAWLEKKIVAAGRWSKPLAIEGCHHLVMDGQHRMEVAVLLGLRRVPVVTFSYDEVEIWSLRPQYAFTWEDVVARALAGDIYPYKTVKHRFPTAIPACDFTLQELRK
ncbi:MAG: hypothetical protein MUF54_00450 [Polyangiaceae bacterium]|jgi:hypothetical protein|nr:hypothetical protein [Polyangiaceae bacterium]